MTSGEKQIGSFGVWLWLRLIQLSVSLLLGGIIIVLLRHGAGRRLELTVVATALVFLNVAFHASAYASANQTGVVFRRYFRKHSVPWQDIADVEYRPFTSGGLVLLLRKPIASSRRVELYLNPSLKDFLMLEGRREPEVYRWVKDGIASASGGNLGGQTSNPYKQPTISPFTLQSARRTIVRALPYWLLFMLALAYRKWLS